MQGPFSVNVLQMISLSLISRRSEVSRDERITVSYPCFLRIFWQQLCFWCFPPLTKNTHEPLRYDYLLITQKRPRHETAREFKLYLFSSFSVRLLIEKLQVITETVEREQINLILPPRLYLNGCLALMLYFFMESQKSSVTFRITIFLPKTNMIKQETPC